MTASKILVSHEAIIERAKRLIERNELPRAIRLLIKATTWFKTDARLWRLLGIAQGYHGNHQGARDAFLEAVDLTCADLDVSNLVTSLWANGEVKQAIEILESQFASLSTEAKSVTLVGVAEAIRVGVVEIDWLPDLVQKHLRDEGMLRS